MAAFWSNTQSAQKYVCTLHTSAQHHCLRSKALCDCFFFVISSTRSSLISFKHIQVSSRTNSSPYTHTHTHTHLLMIFLGIRTVAFGTASLIGLMTSILVRPSGMSSSVFSVLGQKKISCVSNCIIAFFAGKVWKSSKSCLQCGCMKGTY